MPAKVGVLAGERAASAQAFALSEELSETAAHILAAGDPSDARFETLDDPRIPEGQMFFKIGEVAKLTGIKPYVLRYWEAEIPAIRPDKTRSKQRRYRRKDVAAILRIMRLRYGEHLTIERTRLSFAEGKATRPRVQAERAASQGLAKAGGRVHPGRVLARTAGASEGQESVELDHPEAARAAGSLESARVARERERQLPLSLGDEVAGRSMRARALAEMRKAVLELLEAVEE